MRHRKEKRDAETDRIKRDKIEKTKNGIRRQIVKKRECGELG